MQWTDITLKVWRQPDNTSIAREGTATNAISERNEWKAAHREDIIPVPVAAAKYLLTVICVHSIKPRNAATHGGQKFNR